MTTIAQERSGLAAVGLRLRQREEAGFRHDYSTARAVTEPAKGVWIHISVTNPSNYGSDDAHARAIEAIGIARFGSGVSYNRLHMRSGRAYEGQPIGRRGTHTGAYSGNCAEPGCPNRDGNVTSTNHNVTGRGYVICQNIGDAVTDAEFDALARSIAADQLAGFVLRGAPIHGHRCVSTKSCPGPLMWVFMGELERRVNHYVSAGLGAEEDDMTPEQAQQLAFVADFVEAAGWRVKALVDGDATIEYTRTATGEKRAETNRLAHLATLDPGTIADAIIAKLPEGSLDLATVKQGVREVLLEGVDSPTP